MVVPKRLHRILVWGYDPGAEAAGWWLQFHKLHPSWELSTWSDPINPSDWELGRLFESCRSGAQLADLLRIEILWRHGGVYVDSDVEPLSQMDPLLSSSDFFIGTEDGQHMSTGVIGAVQGHPALRSLIDELLEYDELPELLPPNQTTGPLFVSRALDHRNDVLVIPREVFYPYNPYSPYSGMEQWAPWSRRHVICVHHWAASWVAPDDGDAARRPKWWRYARSIAPSRVARRAKLRVRAVAFPALRRVFRQLIEIPTPLRGVYVGDNKMLVSTRDGFSIYAIANDPRLTPDLVSQGWHGEQLLRFLDGVLRPGDWFIDVGANIGLFSLAAAKRVRRWGRVLAYEVDPALADLCQFNASLNCFNNVDVLLGGDLAVRQAAQFESSESPAVRGSSTDEYSDTEVRSTRAGPSVAFAAIERVDDRVPSGVPVRAIKISLEGKVLEVLSGMKRLLHHEMIDYIVIEVQGGNDAAHRTQLIHSIQDIVTSYGAVLGTLDRQGDIWPIEAYPVRTGEQQSPLVIDFTRSKSAGTTHRL